MGFFSKLWTVISGLFTGWGDDLARGNPSAVYDAAIESTLERYRKLMDAVASLATQRERLQNELEALRKEEEELEAKMEGALALAEGEPDKAAVHQAAYERFFARKQAIDAREAAIEPQLEQLKATVEQYKGELRGFQGKLDGLRREKQETLAERQINDALLSVQSQITNLSQDTTDEMLRAVRDHRAQLREKVRIGEELTSNARVGDDTYARAAQKSAGQSEFERLLAARKAQKESAAAAPAAVPGRRLAE